MSFLSVSTASAVWKKCIPVSFLFSRFLILKTFAETLWLAFPPFSHHFLIRNGRALRIFFSAKGCEVGRAQIKLKSRLHSILSSWLSMGKLVIPKSNCLECNQSKTTLFIATNQKQPFLILIFLPANKISQFMCAKWLCLWLFHQPDEVRRSPTGTGYQYAQERII